MTNRYAAHRGSILLVHDLKLDKNDRKTSKIENVQAKWRAWEETYLCFHQKGMNTYENTLNINTEMNIYNRRKKCCMHF
jgi:hypothetical protein